MLSLGEFCKKVATKHWQAGKKSAGGKGAEGGCKNGESKI